MKRSSLVALAAVALTAVVAVGLPSSASAAPGGKGPKSGSANTVKSTTAKADRLLSSERTKVARRVASKDAALVRAARTVTRATLTVGEAEVLANVAADRTALAALKAAAGSATTVSDVRLVGAQVQAVRPEVYDVVVNGLRQAVHFQEVAAANTAAVTDLTTQTDAKELEGYDVLAVRDLLASATTANDQADVLAGSVIDQGLVLTAFSTHADRTAFSDDVETAGTLLDTVAEQLTLVTDALAAMVPAEEPVAEEPLAEQPLA